MPTSIIITAIICLTIVAVCYISKDNNKKDN